MFSAKHTQFLMLRHICTQKGTRSQGNNDIKVISNNFLCNPIAVNFPSTKSALC